MNEHFTDEELNQIEEQIKNNYDKNTLSITTDGKLNTRKIDAEYKNDTEEITIFVGDVRGIWNGEINHLEVVIKAHNDMTIFELLEGEGNYGSEDSERFVESVKENSDMFYITDPFGLRENNK